jgi:hypothetical protein
MVDPSFFTTGWWFQPIPLKNHGVRQIGMMTFPIYGKKNSHKIYVPNHQPDK